ncbi:MAG: thrombospondin type 3 repeat-containing protein [Actinomycetota bacterium]|nr:thrombospondin type 3 repeat-containing protein [Actinomycetota bacterium]
MERSIELGAARRVAAVGVLAALLTVLGGCFLPPHGGGPTTTTTTTTTTAPVDEDSDGVAEPEDNCPGFANADQLDGDSDGVGDTCDNCPSNGNTDQADFDTDGAGDACDPAHLVVGIRSIAVTGGEDAPVIVEVTNDGGVPTSGPVLITFATGSDPGAGNSSGVMLFDQHDGECSAGPVDPGDTCVQEGTLTGTGLPFTGTVIATSGSVSASASYSIDPTP